MDQPDFDDDAIRQELKRIVLEKESIALADLETKKSELSSIDEMTLGASAADKARISAMLESGKAGLQLNFQKMIDFIDRR